MPGAVLRVSTHRLSLPTTLEHGDYYPVLQMKKPTLRSLTLAKGHPLGKWQNQDPNDLAGEGILLISMLQCLSLGQF